MGHAVRVDGSEVRRRRQTLPGPHSLRDISRAARLSIGSLSRIENGLQGARERTVARLAAALSCHPAALVVKAKATPPDRDRIESLERRVAALEAALRRGRG